MMKRALGLLPAAIGLAVAALARQPVRADDETPVLSPAGQAMATPATQPSGAVRQSSRVRVELLASQDAIRPGDRFLLGVRFSFLAPGLHVYGHDLPAASPGLATRVVNLGPAGFRFDRPAYPPSKPVEIAGFKLTEYDRDFIVTVSASAPESLPESEAAFPVRVIYQVCSEQTCFESYSDDAPPLVLTLPVRPGGAEVAVLHPDIFGRPPPPVADGEVRVFGVALTGSDWPLALLFSLVVGLLLNFTPCVLPVIPVTVGFFVLQAQQGRDSRTNRSQLAVTGAAFALGMLATFAAIGTTVVLASARFGELFSHPPVVLGLGLFIIVMALGMFGVYPVQAPGFVGRLAGGRTGLGGGLLMGAVAAMLSTPCTGPVIGGMLGWVGLVPPGLGLAAFLGMGLGMASPYVLLTVVPGLIGRVPRSGPWTEAVKVALGVLLLGLGVSVLAGLSDNRFRYGIWSGLSLSAAVWVAARLIRRRSAGAPTGWLWLVRLVLLGLIIGGIALGWPSDQPEMGPEFRVGSTTWHEYRAEVLVEANRRRQPVLLDFVSDSCTYCRIMDRKVWPTRQAGDALDGLMPVRVNMSRPAGSELARQFGIEGPPALVILDGDGREAQRFFPVTFYDDPASFAAAMGPVRRQLGLDER